MENRWTPDRIDALAAECHYVIAPSDYCARTCQAGSPYCAAHHVIVYRPTARAA